MAKTQKQQKIKKHETRTLSEQDYGPYLDVVTIYEIDGTNYIEASCGYEQEALNDSVWYKMESYPPEHIDLDAYFGRPMTIDVHIDQSKELTEDLDVVCTKVDDPTY